MKKKIIIKFLIVFLTLSLINGSLIFAKEEPKKLEQQEQKLSPEKEKEKEIKTIKELLKELKTLEAQSAKKYFEMFKNFKKEDFEEKNYSLEVFKQNNVPILLYTHKKTGAQVFFSLNKVEKTINKYLEDKLIFKVPSKNNSGLVHFAEHCLASPIGNFFWKKLSKESFNAFTSTEDLSFVSKTGFIGFNEKIEKEYIEKLSKELTNPSVFEKGDKTFEIEKRRILNEMKNKLGMANYGQIEFLNGVFLRNYNSGGEVLKLKNVTLKDFKNFYEKYIHPYNCLLVKNVLELNSKKIKNYLNFWHEKYFKHYNKKEIVGNEYELKNKEKYLFNLWPKDSNIFVVRNEKDSEKDKEQSFNFTAVLYYDLEKLNFKQKLSLNFYFQEVLKDEINNFVKNLGYEKIYIVDYSLNLYGNKKEVFEQKILEENFKKITNFIESKLKNLSEDDFLYCNHKSLAEFAANFNGELNKTYNNANFNPAYYLNEKMTNLVKNSFLETKKVFSEKNFLINKNNELKFSNEIMDECIKQNFNVYSELAKSGPKYIDVFAKSNKTMEQTYKKQQNKYEVFPRVLPIKLKEENSKNFVNDFATSLLLNFLSEELGNKKGLIYGQFMPYYKIENNFVGVFNLNKDSVKSLEDYIFKNFKKIMKNVNIKESELNELKKLYRENFNEIKKNFNFKSENKLLKDLKKYVKTGKLEKDFNFYKKNLKVADLMTFLPLNLHEQANTFFKTLFKDFEDFNSFCKQELSLILKYEKKLNQKLTPKIAEDLLENLFKPVFKRPKMLLN